MNPTLSVVLPAYNAAGFIASAVQSVLDQTFSDFELIVINDGSTDQTFSILQSIAQRDARVQVISRPNTGYVIALNEGVDRSRGELIARMDADDLCLPTRFEKQVAYLQANPDCVLLGTNIAQMDQAGDLIGPMPDIGFGHDAINHALLRRGWPIVHPSIMARKSALRAVGGYVPDLCPNEDHDLFLKLAEVGRVENLPEILLHYRKHAGSVSMQDPQKNAAQLSKIILAACQRRGIPVPPEVAQPTALRTDQGELEEKWAWAALKHQNLKTARKYAWATLKRKPFAVPSWKLSMCAMRGR